MADENNEASNGLNNPEIEVKSGKLEVTQRAITDGEQAYRIATNLESANQTRNDTLSVIWAQYNGESPYNHQALKAAGQSNRHNFPTGFLSSVVDRITPTPKALIDAARYLTSAYLPSSKENPAAAEKTDKLRERVTRAIRRWPEWHTFVTELCQEVVLSGGGFATFLDPFTPWPEFFRLDQQFVPEGTGQHARTVAFTAIKQDKLVHEMVAFIRDKSAAEDAGWDVDEVVEVLDDALPKHHVEGAGDNARTYEDAVREGNAGASHSGATVVELWHIFAVEPETGIDEDPKVTHYIVNRKGNHETLFVKEDRFSSITDVTTLFTLEPGNGKFYGSKGIGRKIINPHLALERTRNRMMDQLEWAGLLILKTDASKAPTVQMRVRHPFIHVTTDADFEQSQIAVNIEAFLSADAKITSLVEQSVGAYIPNIMNDQGGRDKTAREVSEDASRAAEAKVAFLARFWSQFAELISAIQRKLLDSESTDPIAKALQKELREEDGITKEEMTEFANVPAAEVIQDLTQVQSAQIQAVAAKYMGNPSIDSHKLMVRDISGMAFPALADEIVLDPQGLQANEVEGMRQQLLETEAILAGSSIPVSPRDPHEVHLKTIIPDMQKGLPALAQGGGAEMFDNFNAGITHAEGHIQVWEEFGGNPEQLKPYKDAIGEIRNAFEEIAQNAAEMAQQEVPVDESGQPSATPDGAGGSGQPTAPQDAPQGLIQTNPEVLMKWLDLYEEAPDDVKRQIESMSGLQPSAVGAVGNSTLTGPQAQEVDEAVQQPQAPPQLPQPVLPTV